MSENHPAENPANTVDVKPAVDAQEKVTLVDVKIPFWRMVEIFVQMALAAIPAGMIIALVYFILWSVVASVLVLFQR